MIIQFKTVKTQRTVDTYTCDSLALEFVTEHMEEFIAKHKDDIISIHYYTSTTGLFRQKVRYHGLITYKVLLQN